MGENEIKFDTKNYRKHDERNKRLIRASLKELGAGRSILVDKNGVIVAGNGTYEQAHKLKMPVKVIETDGKELVVVKRKDLDTNDAARKKLAVMDNSTSDSSQFDIDGLREDFSIEELGDMGIGGLELPEIEEDYLAEEPEILQYDENVFFPSKNKYDIPELREDMLWDGDVNKLDICWGPKDTDLLEQENGKTYLCLFGQHKISETARDNIIGFFVDDERFEQVWDNAVKVLDDFKRIKPKALLAPNFSLWADVPLPYQIFNWYKTQWCARFWQEAGFKVIPTLNWSTERSFEFCFLGLPKNIPVVAIQCRNIKTAKEKKQFLTGLLKAKETINFKKCICYGENINDFKDFLEDVDYCCIRSWNSKKKEQNQ